MAGRAPKILIVEDDRQIRLLLRNTMTRVGYQVVEAADARAALAAAAGGGGGRVRSRRRLGWVESRQPPSRDRRDGGRLNGKRATPCEAALPIRRRFKTPTKSR